MFCVINVWYINFYAFTKERKSWMYLIGLNLYIYKFFTFQRVWDKGTEKQARKYFLCLDTYTLILKNASYPEFIVCIDFGYIIFYFVKRERKRPEPIVCVKCFVHIFLCHNVRQISPNILSGLKFSKLVGML